MQRAPAVQALRGSQEAGGERRSRGDSTARLSRAGPDRLRKRLTTMPSSDSRDRVSDLPVGGDVRDSISDFSGAVAVITAFTERAAARPASSMTWVTSPNTWSRPASVAFAGSLVVVCSGRVMTLHERPMGVTPTGSCRLLGSPLSPGVVDQLFPVLLALGVADAPDEPARCVAQRPNSRFPERLGLGRKQ